METKRKPWDKEYFIPQKELMLLRKFDERCGIQLHSKRYGKFKKFRVVYKGHYYDVKYKNRNLVIENKVETIVINKSFIFAESIIELFKQNSKKYEHLKLSPA